MHSKIITYLLDLRSSYWFIPAIMSLMSIALSVIAISIDSRLSGSPPPGWEWLFENQPDGARAVLSTIAGSMITVAGVVFSITLVTVSSAASRFGPRLLTNFMRDQTNQITLGTFIATFLYCLLILRAVQSAPPGASDAEAAYFVPHIALLIGIGFALCSIAVLIRFIHHVPQTIHISLVTAKIGRELLARVSQRFPENFGQGGETEAAQNNEIDDVPKSLQHPVAKNVVTIEALSAGFIRVVLDKTLLEFAKERNLVMRLGKQPGDFVLPGETLISLPIGTQLDDDDTKRLRSAFGLGPKRTPDQDIRFLVQELVEIASRALSPGVNDPITAISSLNWLSAALIEHSNKDDPSALRHDDQGHTRIVTPQFGFADLLEQSFGSLRAYVATDPTATAEALELLERIAKSSNAPNRKALESEKMKLLASAKAAMTSPTYKYIPHNMP